MSDRTLTGAGPADLEPDDPASESPLPDDLELVRATLTAAVLGHDGVLRIEPTLAGPTLIGMAQSIAGHGDAAHNLRVTRQGRVIDVTAHLAVRADHQARMLAHRLRADLIGLIAGLGLVPGVVEISILAIEPAEAGF